MTASTFCPDPDEVVELARRLVAMPSITGSEGSLCRFIAQTLTAESWQVTTQEIPPEGRLMPDIAEPRLNVLAQTADEEIKVVLTTHLDTVPPFIPPSEDEEWLYGRGTCDAKGIFAAQWIAARRLRAEGVKGVALLGVVGEETNSIGAKSAHVLLKSARWIIDGEPTDLKLAHGAKGVLLLRLSARGIAAHSAYPERGHSAVHELLDVLHRVLSLPPFAETEFGPTTLNVGRIEGGVAPNVVAPEAQALVMIRLGTDSAKVEREVLRVIREVAQDRVEVEVVSRSEPHRIHVPEGFDSALVRFGSDVPHLAKLGTPLLVGPGSIHDAHTPHERIRKADLVRAVDLYVALVRRLLDA